MPLEEGPYPGGDTESRDGCLQIAGALVSCPRTPCFSQKSTFFCAKCVGCVRPSGCTAAIDYTSGQQELSELRPELAVGGGWPWLPPPQEGRKQHPDAAERAAVLFKWLFILLFLLLVFGWWVWGGFLGGFFGFFLACEATGLREEKKHLDCLVLPIPRRLRAAPAAGSLYALASPVGRGLQREPESGDRIQPPISA